MVPKTTTRVTRNTAAKVNENIARKTAQKVRQVARGGRASIDRRLRELDYEWDIERTLEANAATVGLIGLALGGFVDRRFLAVPALVSAFLLQHAIQGWCPPVPVVRRFGVRTQTEIDHERYALKALRGDFQSVPTIERDDPAEGARALEAARA
jgi:hypothetical protein